MLEDYRAGLLTMAVRTVLVQPGHSQSTRRFHNIHPVRVVALDTIHPAFQHGMMLREMKFRPCFLVALEARFGVFARIDDELLEAALAGHGDVPAPRAVAGFTTVPAGPVGLFQTQSRVRTGWERA